MPERVGLDKIIGEDLAKRVLGNTLRSKEPSHAYLFLGPEGTGKCTTALEFAKSLNCENAQGPDACGRCAICHAVEHGNFPDIRIFSPEGQNTRIDQMREMRDMALLKPMRGKWKVNIIEQGDTLNEESANCILKLLEEPPDYLVNILIFRNAANVLPTIRSRCQLVRFTQVSIDELASRLVEDFGADAGQADFAAKYSQGRAGTAIALLGNESFFKRRDSVIAAAANLCGSNPWLALKSAEMLRSGETQAEEDEPDEDSEPRSKKKPVSRGALIESVDMLLVWYRDLLAAKLQGDLAPIVNSDRRDQVLAQSACYADAAKLLNALDAIIQAKRGILGNANAQITTESLIMRIAAL